MPQRYKMRFHTLQRKCYFQKSSSSCIPLCFLFYSLNTITEQHVSGYSCSLCYNTISVTGNKGYIKITLDFTIKNTATVIKKYIITFTVIYFTVSYVSLAAS